MCSLLTTSWTIESILFSIWPCQHSTQLLSRRLNGLDGAWWHHPVVDCWFHPHPQPLRGKRNHHGAVVCKGKVLDVIPSHHPIAITQHHPYQLMIFKMMLPGDTLWTSTLCRNAGTNTHTKRLLPHLAIDATTATTKPFHQRYTIPNCFLIFSKIGYSIDFGNPFFHNLWSEISAFIMPG